MNSIQPQEEPIAIIGIGLRLPGGVSSAKDFWDLLIDGKDGKCRVPSDRYNVDSFHKRGTDSHPLNVVTEYGYFLKDTDPQQYDSSMFSAVAGLDPQQRLLCEAVWECLESAGQTNLRGTNTGVFIGCFGEDWHNIIHSDKQLSSLNRVVASGDFVLSNRISYEFDIRGPSITVRTACSASITALHMACQALRAGDCPVAIVGGTSFIMEPGMTLDMSRSGVLSPSGTCKTFDASADGFARGEAVNAILIKPFKDAIRDGDSVRAVIRSTSINSDGKLSRVGCPSSEAQVAAIKRAYQIAGIEDFSQTPFIECHGTGTPVGDPIEVAAIAEVFGGKGDTYIGSVKPNVGHGEGASGITSIIKAVLSLENQTIPPNIHFFKPGCSIPLEKYNLTVPVKAVSWPKDRCERVSVNSFGIGGANGHVIVDSAASFGIERPKRKLTAEKGSKHMQNGTITNGTPVPVPSTELTSMDDRVNSFPHENARKTTCQRDATIGHEAVLAVDSWPLLLPVSANSEKSLERRINDLQQYIRFSPDSLNDVAHTLGRHRIHLSYRSFCAMKDVGDEESPFASPVKFNTGSTSPKVVYVFTGQGAQWSGMGRSLIRGSPSFLEDIRGMDAALQQMEEPPNWKLEDRLASSDENHAKFLEKPDIIQPLCTAIQLGLVNFLSRCGVMPAAVIGHSSGEVAAAYAAGAMNTKEAIINAYIRGKVAAQSPLGSMASIDMGRDDVVPFLIDGTRVACENSPKNTTISGDTEAVDRVLKTIKARQPDTFTRMLPVAAAYHSQHMSELGSLYEKLLTPYLSSRTASGVLYSSTHGRIATERDEFGPSYWRNNFASPVLFNSAMNDLLRDIQDGQILLEVGSHSSLQAPIGQIMRGLGRKIPTYLPTLLRGAKSATSLVTCAGKLYTLGYQVDFSFINGQASPLTDLPNYPWDYKKDAWQESRISRAWRFKEHLHHELLGSRCLESSNAEPIWRNILQLADVDWLRDHRVGSTVLFPGAGYVAIMGEAVKQTFHSKGYVLRNVMVKSPLMLSEKEPVEIMTSLRPARLTQLTNSSWSDLSISSFNGSSWVELCIAQGKSGTDNIDMSHAEKDHKITAHPRKLSNDYFYTAMGWMGLNYGPRFEVLHDISAHPENHIASASIINEIDDKASYTVHPTVIDGFLQLCAASMLNGVARSLDTAKLPVYIGQITINPGEGCLLVEAVSEIGRQTHRVLALSKQTNNVSALIEDMKAMPYFGGQSDTGRDLHAARLEWRPDIDCLVANDLIQHPLGQGFDVAKLEKLTNLAILQASDVIKCNQASGHLLEYSSWLLEERDILTEKDPIAQHWVTMDVHSRWKLLDSAIEDIHKGGNQQLSTLADTIRSIVEVDTLASLLTGELEPSTVARDENIDTIYELFSNMSSADEFLQLCAHANPAMAILQIGVGMGNATEEILESLTSKEGIRMYGKYVLADTSIDRLESVKKRFKTREKMEYQLLDIAKDPTEQGFKAASFDLIVAPHSMRTYVPIQKSLRHFHTLLRPGGRIYLTEPIVPLGHQSLKLVLGLFPMWWAGKDDGRLESPYISLERWATELQSAGFSGLDIAVSDEDEPRQCYAHIVSTVVSSAVQPNAVTILYNDNKHEFALKLAHSLENNGVAIQWLTLPELTAGPVLMQDIISTIDLERPYLENVSEDEYKTLIAFVSRIKKGVLWLTRAAQVDANNPSFGLMLGLARTIRTELSVDFWTAELQQLDTMTCKATMAIIRKFWDRDLAVGNVDKEYSVRDGMAWTGRYHWTSTLKSAEAYIPKTQPKQLVIGQFGRIDSLHWVSQEIGQLAEDEVEVEIRCVGLNFRDIMVSMGFVPGPKDDIGLEATGIVVRVGSAINHLQKGDRVSVLATGLISTRKIVQGTFVTPLPPHLTFEEAATMQIVFATAIYALIMLGQLEKGQSVLIHSAAGGVGQAAIQICQMLGAEVYATVGTEEKIEFLIANHGIPRERIFSSRDVSFLNKIMQSTEDRGVDLVLNSLSGELLHASWQCVAKYGKMLEIGKRDILEQARLPMNGFGDNRTFYGIDLLGIMAERPALAKRLGTEIAHFMAGNAVKAIQPIHAFAVTETSEALRFMQKGQHIGKILVSFPQQSEECPVSERLEAIKEVKPILLSGSRTYLIVGGLGGIGRAVAIWLVEKGARSLLFLSRSAGKEDSHREFFQELEVKGCQATAILGSVSEIDDVKRAIAAAPSPIAGVLQMSMVLTDTALTDLSYSQWKSVQDPKVKGTWNLHNSLLETNANLDFFILFASISGLIGHPYQANYCSSNTFLDSFVSFRHGMGLPCSVIDLGAVHGIGYLADKASKINQYREGGLYLLQEQEVVDSVHVSIVHSMPPAEEARYLGEKGSCQGKMRRRPYTAMSQVAVGLKSTKPLSDPTSSTVLKYDIRSSVYGNMETDNLMSADSMDAGLQRFLQMAGNDPQLLTQSHIVDFVCREVGLTLLKFMQMPEDQLDVTATLTSIGIDSLVTIEIRNWWRRTLGLDMTVTEIMNARTIEGLGKLAIGRLQDKYGVQRVATEKIISEGLSNLE